MKIVKLKSNMKRFVAFSKFENLLPIYLQLAGDRDFMLYVNERKSLTKEVNE